ncbi:hypothetical protein ABR737_00540 [Streptomyces sp. Edi2]|uniref:hypothetical protein n=1 Tax=Streptomyces sp. Edi2 TaxID=3162528 RepID=UPI003305DB1E
MTRSRIAVPALLLAALALSACSSSSPGASTDKDDADQPLTKQFSQGEITQAIPERGEAPAGYELSDLGKGRPGTADDCSHTEGESPRGWKVGGDTEYFYNGSSRSRKMSLNICQFNTSENAKSAYTAWTHRSGLTDEGTKAKVGEESAFLLKNKSGSVYAYTRSGTVNIEVKIEDSGGDATSAHDMLAATLKRLEQVQAGKRPTATAADEAAKAEQQ